MNRSISMAVAVGLGLALTPLAQATMVTNLTTGTLLFFDNYESVSPVSTSAAYDGSVDADPVAVVGSWTTLEPFDQGIVQVTSSVITPANTNGTKCLRMYRDATHNNHDVYGNLTAQQNTAGQTIHFETMAYIDSQVNARAIFAMTGSSSDFVTSTAVTRPNGAGVVATMDYNGGAYNVYNTTVPYQTNTWQKWTMDYTIGATNFTFSVDGVSGSGITHQTAAGVHAMYIFNANDPAGSFYLDDVPPPKGMALILQ